MAHIGRAFLACVCVDNQYTRVENEEDSSDSYVRHPRYMCLLTTSHTALVTQLCAASASTLLRVHAVAQRPLGSLNRMRKQTRRFDKLMRNLTKMYQCGKCESEFDFQPTHTKYACTNLDPNRATTLSHGNSHSVTILLSQDVSVRV